MKMKTVTNFAEARKLRDACESGQLLIVRERDEDGSMLNIIKSKGGTTQAYIGKKCEFIFAEFMHNFGSGDGLFPGFDQTFSAGGAP